MLSFSPLLTFKRRFTAILWPGVTWWRPNMRLTLGYSEYQCHRYQYTPADKILPEIECKPMHALLSRSYRGQSFHVISASVLHLIIFGTSFSSRPATGLEHAHCVAEQTQPSVISTKKFYLEMTWTPKMLPVVQHSEDSGELRKIYNVGQNAF